MEASRDSNYIKTKTEEGQEWLPKMSKEHCSKAVNIYDHVYMCTSTYVCMCACVLVIHMHSFSKYDLRILILDYPMAQYNHSPETTSN